MLFFSIVASSIPEVPRKFRHYVKAYGDTYDEFEDILMRPHHFIFNRNWYEKYEGRPEYEEYKSIFKRISADEKHELVEFLSTFKKSDYSENLGHLAKGKLRDLASFYIPLPREQEEIIWSKMKSVRQIEAVALQVPDDERVEDATLTDEDILPLNHSPKPLAASGLA